VEVFLREKAEALPAIKVEKFFYLSKAVRVPYVVSLLDDVLLAYV
jgi:hypothetical protein